MLVLDDEHAGEASIDVRTGEVHGVVVVPEARGGLLERIAVGPGHRARPTARTHRPRLWDAWWENEIRRKAVELRRRAASVEVQHRRHGQLVPELELQRAPGPGAHSWPGERPVVRPQPGASARKDLDVRLTGDEPGPILFARACHLRVRRDGQRHLEPAWQRHRAPQQRSRRPHRLARGAPRAPVVRAAVPRPNTPRACRRVTVMPHHAAVVATTPSRAS